MSCWWRCSRCVRATHPRRCGSSSATTRSGGSSRRTSCSPTGSAGSPTSRRPTPPNPRSAFFRSPLPGRSWITAAGALLDSAALLLSTIDTPHQPEPQLCIRSGFLSLRRIADFFGIPSDPDPAPTDPITVDRSEFDEACRTLAAAGVPLRDDLDDAWRNFAGWRVNYDRVLVSLAGFLMAPLAPWSSDRSIYYRQRTLLPRPRMRLPSRLRRRRAGTSSSSGTPSDT